ncbi:bromodomain adjacent to zinc finger domain protein 2A isoform X2 [Ambystoma mexicanum]|uniref:bromodomain adjacent to zinc finger domain protein 2A isoform X2 n=1 Tax=Ambystoma mexicanum TaxID=8296 RepID=UPI0037E9B672
MHCCHLHGLLVLWWICKARGRSMLVGLSWRKDQESCDVLLTAAGRLTPFTEEMETNDHSNYTAVPPASNTLSLKSDNLYTNRSTPTFTQQGKGLNGDLNVNGLAAVSPTNSSGTFASTTHSSNSSLVQHPNVACDYLWNYTQCQPTNSANPKDSQLVPHLHALAAYQLNGLAESLQPACTEGSTVHDPEHKGKGSHRTMELGFHSPELYDSFHDEKFGPLQNGPTDFYSTPRPSPMLSSSIQAFATTQCPEQESSQLGEVCVKDILPIAVGETVELETLEPSDAQIDVNLGSYNGTSPQIDPLDVPVLQPPPDVTSCLDDSSQLSSQLEDSHLLSSEGLEPFGTDLSQDSVDGALYDLEETTSEVERSSLGATADLSALDCTESQPFANTSTFSLLTEDSQNSTSLYAATAASSILEGSVMQDDGFDLQSETDGEMEGDRMLGLSLPLEPDFQNISLQEVVDVGCPEAIPEEELVQKGSTGDIQRRRTATAEDISIPLKHGWIREVRIKKGSHRWQGETWYYAPCGKRMKQFPEVIKYLSRNPAPHVQREHFSFSPRMPVGDFYEERSTAEGLQWVKLFSEEIPSCILAITGKRGRPRNMEKLKTKGAPRLKRGRGRPPKVKAVDLLTKMDSKLMKNLEAQDELSNEDKLMLRKIKKKMRRKERNKRKQESEIAALKEAEKQAKLEKKNDKARKEEEIRREEEEKELVKERVKLPEQEKVTIRRVERKVLAKRRMEELAQRKLEERHRQQLILEEMKKPTEDMCLVDHQPLPVFSRIPGLFLPSRAFSDCLTVVAFLHSYGKVLGFDVAKEVPSLCTLQEGLFNVGDSLGEVMDLLIKLVRLVLRDPGLPTYYQSLKVLGEKILEIELNRDTVSEVLRIFMEIYGADLEICDSLRSKPFQAHPAETKATILAFLVNELNGSAIIIREIDKALENMSKQRRNKWFIEGRLRRLKITLAKKMGRPESEITCMEQRRRRSSRAAAEEAEEASGDGASGRALLEVDEDEGGAKRSMMEDEGESPSAASILELERQIEKLTKKQTVFRKKLLQASQALRAVSLGQDRYRRQYWVLPNLGGIFVEGMEPTTAQDGFFEEKEETVQPLITKHSPIKAEPTEILIPDRTKCVSPRARGRPRKTKAVPEMLPLPPAPSPPPALPLQQQVQPQPSSPPPPLQPDKTQQKQAESQLVNGFFEDTELIAQSQHDLSQSAFLSWLSQTQSSLVSSSVLTPASSPGNPETDPLPPEEILECASPLPEPDIADTETVSETTEKTAPWFHLLPRTPCDPSLVDHEHTASTEDPSRTASLHSVDSPCSTSPSCAKAARTSRGLYRATLHTDVPFHLPAASTPIHNTRAHNPLRKLPDNPKRPPPAGCLGPGPPKRRGRPPTKFLKQIEQKYFTQLKRHPIPEAMQSGWWWIRDPAEFEAVLKVLHPRGIREKTLLKHLAKHKEYLKEVCVRPNNDPIFQLRPDAGHNMCPYAREKWSTVERALEVDLSILQWVEELEQRVVYSDLQLRGWMLPALDSTREDLQYYEHKVDPLEDITIKVKKEGMELWRVNTHPLDRAVQRLADLELNIERRYLKEPLWVLSEVFTEKLVLTQSENGEVSQTELEYEITPRLRIWRQTVERCRSAAQLSLCVYQLDKSIAWEKSVNKVTCLVCRKGDNDELLLLCESCDRGCHTYCHRPKISEVPSEDWFCPICISRQADGEYFWPQSSQNRGTKRRTVPPSFLDDTPKTTMTMRRRDNCGMGVSRYSGEGLSPSKRRRISVRNDDNGDLAFCEIILMEMESQDDAWPFLEPVNPRLVPGYRKVIKKPMDFSTMREKLLTGGYSCCEEFAADAMLVFNNCQMFNEDDSEVGKAGLVMKSFYESRWDEFYRGKMQENH